MVMTATLSVGPRTLRVILHPGLFRCVTRGKGVHITKTILDGTKIDINSSH